MESPVIQFNYSLFFLLFAIKSFCSFCIKAISPGVSKKDKALLSFLLQRRALSDSIAMGSGSRYLELSIGCYELKVVFWKYCLTINEKNKKSNA